MRSRAVILGNAQLDCGVAALEVGADRRDEDAELVLVSGLDADDVTRGDHEGADIESSAAAKGRHPVLVGLDDLLDSIDEAILREGGHAQALRGVSHALGVEVRAEADNLAGLGGVGLQALEDLLAVVEDTSALGKLQGMVLRKEALAPSAVLVIADVGVISLHIAEGEIAPVDILLCHENHLLFKRAGKRAVFQVPDMVPPGRVSGTLIVSLYRQRNDLVTVVEE